MNEFDIPILKKAYELYKIFHGYRKLIPKQDRFTIFERTENILLDVIEGIFQASQLPKQKKIPILEQVSLKLNMLRLFFRLMKDVKALDIKKYIALEEIVDEIGRMLGGWIRSFRSE